MKHWPAYISCWCHQNTTLNLSMQKQKSCIKKRREAEFWTWSAVPELQWEWPCPEWCQPQGLCRRKRLHQPGSGALLHPCYWFPQSWEEGRPRQDSPGWTRILQTAASDLMCFSYLTLQGCRAAIPQLQASRQGTDGKGKWQCCPRGRLYLLGLCEAGILQITAKEVTSVLETDSDPLVDYLCCFATQCSCRWTQKTGSTTKTTQILSAFRKVQLMISMYFDISLQSPQEI